MNARASGGRLLTGLACAALLAGCASSTATTDPMTVVTGTVTCPTAVLPTATPDAKGIQPIRSGKVECTVKANDPRVSGTRTDAWNMNIWEDPDGNGARAVQWGTSRLVNAKGAWEGSASGVAALPEWGDIITTWYKGSGDYAGLAYFELITGKGPWRIQGQIIPGDPPTSAGTAMR